MRLLEKKLVIAEVATQKKEAIDKGLQLAKKVDALREAKATEEKNLEDFRLNTVSKVKEEIDGLIRSKEALKADLMLLMQQRKEAQEPLDGLKQALDEREEQIAVQEMSTLHKLAYVDQQIQELEEKEKKILEDEQRIAAAKQRADQKLEEADAILKDAQRKSEELQEKARNALTEADLERREAKLKIEETENYVAMLGRKEKNLDERQSTIDIKERELRDRYNTLERTIKRLNL